VTREQLTTKRPSTDAPGAHGLARGMRRRRAMGAPLVILIGAAMASCGQAPGSSGGVPTITIWNDALAQGSCGFAPADSFLTKGVALFAKTNPGFNVSIIQQPCDGSDAFGTLLKSAEVAGTTPDIVQLFVGGQVIQNAKYLVPLKPKLSQSYINSLTGWRYLTQGYKDGGEIYGVPYGAGYEYTVYYNKQMFATAGITGPLPATWPEMVAAAHQLKSKGITPFEIGEQEGYMGAWTQDSLISGLVGDKGVLDMYTGKASLNSTTLTAPYTAWRQLFSEGLTNADAPSLPSATAITQFAAGKAAMTFTGGFYNSQISKGLGSNVGLFPIPTLTGSQSPNSLSGGPNNEYSIFKASTHVDQALRLIQFLTTLQVQTLSVEELGQAPNNVEFKSTPDFAAKQPLIAQLSDLLATNKYTLGEAFDNIMPGSVMSYWYKSNNAVFGGTLSPDSAASSMQSQMQSYISSGSTG
jgi:raffinose/stachyose/melibiose transport system substrate-binding protein